MAAGKSLKPILQYAQTLHIEVAARSSWKGVCKDGEKAFLSQLNTPLSQNGDSDSRVLHNFHLWSESTLEEIEGEESKGLKLSSSCKGIPIPWTLKTS